MLSSVVIGSYIVLSGTVENVQDVSPKLSKSEISSITQRETSEADLQKIETNIKIVQNEKIDQDEKIEVDEIKVEKEETTKRTLKPHHLYVRNAKEMETILLKRAQQWDQEKRLKILREKHSLKREL